MSLLLSDLLVLILVSPDPGSVCGGLTLFVCSEVLFRELESRQTALRHFIHYLTETRDQRLLLELLR